jgi:hypothetical protein
MTSTLLMVASAAVFGLLGTLHLFYTFRGPAFFPRDRALKAAMETTSPLITKETTMWRCWIGFNASHSLGPMFFGMVYGYLALEHSEMLFGSHFLLALGLLMLVAFALLARAYWFRIPLVGICLSLGLYVASVAVALAR